MSLSSYNYSFNQFVLISGSYPYIPSFIEKIKNEAQIVSTLFDYQYDNNSITLLYETDLTTEEENIINYIISLYNVSVAKYVEKVSIEEKSFIGGIGTQAFGTSTLYNGTMMIQVVQPLSQYPIILLTQNNIAASSSSSNTLSYSFTPGYPLFYVHSSNATDNSQFSWFLAKY